SDSDAPLKDTFPHPPASDIDPNEAHHPATVPAASSTLKTGRGRRRGPYNVNPHKTRSSANTPQPMSANSTHDQTGLRKPRMEKDPNAPRRPANAFVLYCQVERPNIRSRGTDLTYGEMTKAMGIKWKNLSQAEKKKYFDLYEREMFRYQQELETYKGGNSSYGGLTAVASSSANPSAVPSSARSEASSVAAALTAVPFADGADRLSHNGDMDIDADGSIGGDSHMAEYHKDDGSVGSELHTNSAPPSSVVLAAGVEFSSPQLAGSNGHHTLDDDMPSSPIAIGDDHNDVGSSVHKSTAVPVGSAVVSHQA
ncbi:non-histone protein, partial [Kickxella alabastrina]